MIVLAGIKFAENNAEFLESLFHEGSTCSGYAKRLKRQVNIYDMQHNIIGAVTHGLFLACADKRIYNFSLYGLKTEGFVPVKTEAEVVLPIRYVHRAQKTKYNYFLKPFLKSHLFRPWLTKAVYHKPLHKALVCDV